MPLTDPDLSSDSVVVSADPNEPRDETGAFLGCDCRHCERIRELNRRLSPRVPAVSLTEEWVRQIEPLFNRGLADFEWVPIEEHLAPKPRKRAKPKPPSLTLVQAKGNCLRLEHNGLILASATVTAWRWDDAWDWTSTQIAKLSISPADTKELDRDRQKAANQIISQLRARYS